jgi:hypothetical protein
VLQKIKPHGTIKEFGETPEKDEIKSVIKKITYGKAPGATSLSTNMVKSLHDDATDFLTKIIQEFWRNQDTNFDSWHVTSPSILYKRKGDPEDLNNYRGICLKETTAKIISIIISNSLLKRLEEIGDRSQFGHIGCQEAQHTIKRALLLRRQHGIPTFALFVDLVKAFDTIQHQLLFILQRYGLPASIEKLFFNCQVEFKNNNKKNSIQYTTGVQQGDNMSTILFLFVMQAFMDTLNIDAPSSCFCYFPEHKNGVILSNSKNPSM